jgi:hypothetical protein
MASPTCRFPLVFGWNDVTICSPAAARVPVFRPGLSGLGLGRSSLLNVPMSGGKVVVPGAKLAFGDKYIAHKLSSDSIMEAVINL